MLDGTLGTLVTYNPRAVTPDTTLEELQAVMREIQVRHVPVVDEESRIVGLVSERDLACARYNAAVMASHGVESSIHDKRVEQIMARQVLTLEHFEAPEIALRVMVAHAFHSVPVTEDGKLLGMITSTDFLRELSYGQWEGFDEPVRRRMSLPGHTVDGDTALSNVLQTAEHHNQEFVAVIRRNRPLGVLSRTALRQTLCDATNRRDLADLQSTPVRLMLPLLPTLPAMTALGRAAGIMLEHHARALPVVDRSRILIGLLQEDDILRALVERLDNADASDVIVLERPPESTASRVPRQALPGA